jgi:hypothetical protein
MYCVSKNWTSTPEQTTLLCTGHCCPSTRYGEANMPWPYLAQALKLRSPQLHKTKAKPDEPHLPKHHKPGQEAHGARSQHTCWANTLKPNQALLPPNKSSSTDGAITALKQATMGCTTLLPLPARSFPQTAVRHCLHAPAGDAYSHGATKLADQHRTKQNRPSTHRVLPSSLQDARHS